MHAVLLAVATAAVLAGCSEATSPAPPPTSVRTATPAPAPPQAAPAPAQPRLAPDPVKLADDLADDEQTLRDRSASEPVLAAAARRQQAAYRAIGRHPEWDEVVRPRIPPALLPIYDLNVDARRHLDRLVSSDTKATVPAWRIDAPAPADELLRYYHEADAATGVGWNYLAAINFVETTFGRIVGPSSAGAQGPMQFLPSTFAAYGDGGDIHAPRDSIIAAGRKLAANGFAYNPDGAIYAYNHSNDYVRAVSDYADVLAADPGAFAGYYRWEIYYRTTAGDVLLPVGYLATAPIAVADYLAAHPQ
ncbi:lytic transglycosylase [Mycobacterium sp. 852013-50091_SCH5140682]|uniref:lytic transglycosylase domain-containing protein n=1 Tax=Mycobacterium sp. 852013-50091_SCH5140682 TaxID=1834109 RepID=UPI0007EB0FD8|nr:lytic transglycosylase domain-containing protein [Mycobacterium sp. 852013-50091_SCH5140682]OBC00532.1 lytic transglycosylase [Mycobacterium sp. 852013-50091_SCH5140682]